MATPIIQPSFITGEVAPALFGRTDLARYHSGASTMRNIWPRYQGGGCSRAGTARVGFSKQTGRAYAPRLIPFQFSNNQGLALEFGHLYMRVIEDGGYVLDTAVYAITGATQASPCVLTYNTPTLVTAASPTAGAVITASYAPGDSVTLAGGTFSTRAVVNVDTTQIYSLAITTAGSGYGVGNTLLLYGGSQSSQAYATVTSVGGGGSITGVSISNAGVFLQNAPTLIAISLSTFAADAVLTPIYAPNAVTVTNQGVYTVLPGNPVAQFSTTGSGSGGTFDITATATGSTPNDGDWMYITDIGGMTQLNGRTFVIANVTGTTFELQDVYGNDVDSTGYAAYTSGGTANKIYELATPWREEDLDWLKYTQSADVMSFCCVNQISRVEYQQQDMVRSANNSWALQAVVPTPSVSPPATSAATASAAGSTTYAYRVTAVADDGTESVGSPIATVVSAVNIAATAGTIRVDWGAVTGIKQYNIYKATPSFTGSVPTGSLFGFAGSSYGNSFNDSNIVPDFAQVPPRRDNPFARGKIISLNILTPGASIAGLTYVINTSTGSGASLTPVLSPTNTLVAVIVDDGGAGYADGDTITFSVSSGTAPTASLNVGPQSGTYPSVVSYDQQRRVYGGSLNNPDTYWMSQPGAYTNFDKRIPTIDSDAITGTPWGLQVNGIQFFVPMPGGLVVLTGLAAWQINGGSAGAAITPASQNASQQAFNGCSSTVPPIKIDFDIVYLQAKGAIYRDLSYNFFSNIYTGVDLTLNSPHLFNPYQILGHAWCEEPNKILWSVRSDGILLSLTFLKQQEVAGWARHDTNGKFVSVCSVTEPPVDALYCAVQRTIGSNSAYLIERMDNRNWQTVENVWAVDCGQALAQPTPAAALTASSAYGAGQLTGVTGLVGGSDYSPATTARVVDDYEGPGSGAVPVLTIANGVIAGVSFSSPGANYRHPRLVIEDPAGTGSGAEAVITLDNSATFTADASVFVVGDVGSVIRMGGGKAEITGYTSGTQVTANILDPITAIQPNGTGAPMVAASGAWTLTAPVSTIYVPDLAGATITGLYDGNVLEPTLVPADGVVTLPAAASSVVVGFGFEAQLQSLYLDAGEPTQQGRRKKIAAVTARVELSRGLKAGTNQPDGSTLSPPSLAPTWQDLDDVPDLGIPSYLNPTPPLYTGDVRVPVQGGFQTKGQVCIQQDQPLPLNILAFINEVYEGDRPEQAAAQRDRGRK